MPVICEKSEWEGGGEGKREKVNEQVQRKRMKELKSGGTDQVNIL